MKFLTPFCSFALLLLLGCGNPASTTYPLEISQKITIEQPMSEGPNTGQAIVTKADLIATAKAQGFDLTRATAISVGSITLEVDTAAGKLFSNYAIQLVAGNLEMAVVALSDNMPAGSTKITTQPSTKTDLKPYFTGNEDLTWVLDANATTTDTLIHEIKLVARLQVQAPAEK